MSDTVVQAARWALTSVVLILAAGWAAHLAGRRRYFLAGASVGAVLTLWASLLQLALT